MTNFKSNASVLLMKDTIAIDETKFFIHSHDSEDVVIILNLNDNSNEYLKLSYFAADVVRFIISHAKCTVDELTTHLTGLYESSEKEIKKEISQVFQKLEEYSILS